MFDIPQEYVNESQQALSGGGIRLPFPVVYTRWINGQATAKRTEGKKDISDARYYGGWEIGADQVEEFVSITGKANPANFALVTQTTKKGGEYEAYITRWIAFSPIIVRERWTTTEQGGKRSHVQFLGYMAEVSGGAYNPWGATVLTATGLSGAAIKDAISSFGVKTAEARRQFANNLPPMFFWNLLGTFGERQQKMVGRGNNQSPITPCQVYLGKEDKVGKETLEKLFVGKEIVELRHELLTSAREWVDAWKNAPESDTTPEDFQLPSGDDLIENLDTAFGSEVPF